MEEPIETMDFPDKVDNLAGLRSLAVLRLRSEGYVPLTVSEGRYIGALLGAEGQEITWSLAYDVETLDLGKWELLTTWLSPRHEATNKHPQAMAAIARKLLGFQSDG